MKCLFTKGLCGNQTTERCIIVLICAAIQGIGSEELFHSAMDSADRRNCKSVYQW